MCSVLFSGQAKHSQSLGNANLWVEPVELVEAIFDIGNRQNNSLVFHYLRKRKSKMVLFASDWGARSDRMQCSKKAPLLPLAPLKISGIACDGKNLNFFTLAGAQRTAVMAQTG
jgi:hypothetical protein